MKPTIINDWQTILEEQFSKPYFKELQNFVDLEFKNHRCFPKEEEIFAAFNFCSFKDLKVVIIGQDPYHGENQANGLCFSVKDGFKKPPSLVNIYKELAADLSIEIPESGNLENWAKQGVLLLNATLTVRANQAGSHQQKGWETFTDNVIKLLSKDKEKVVFLLWGKFAESKKALIDTSKHQVFIAPHPSPLGAWRGWFGCKHFSRTNTYLKQTGQLPIVW